MEETIVDQVFRWNHVVAVPHIADMNSVMGIRRRTRAVCCQVFFIW